MNRSKRMRAALAAPALALALAACGGDTGETVATGNEVAQPQAAAAAPVEPTLPPVPDDAPVASETATAQAPVAEAAEAPAVIEKLSAELAIANAESNIGNLAEPAAGTSVIDFEVLAVADGSIQTLGDVVVGDRPVLLWFFSPH